MLLKKHPRETEKGFCPEIPAAFSSLVQARNSLDYHWNTRMEFLNDLESDTGSVVVEGQWPLDALGTIEAAREIAFNVVDRWLVAYRAFLQKHGRSLDGREMQAARTLEISHRLAMIFLTVSITYSNNDLTVWDWFTEDFEYIVGLATLILKSPNGDKFTKNQGPYFTLDMSIVAPLFVVASKCRHPIIRRKAVALLYATPRQEGIWDSVLTARVAERLIGIEEAGLGNIDRCENVPDWARISEVGVKFDLQERLGTVKYSRQRSKLNKVRDTVVESVRW